MAPPVPALAAAVAPPIFRSLPPEKSQFYKDNLRKASISGKQIAQFKQELIDSCGLLIKGAIKDFEKISDDLTTDDSELRIAKKWSDDLSNYVRHNDADPDEYLTAAFLMHQISQQKPIQNSETYVMINEIFASFIGFNMIGINMYTISTEVFSKFLLHLNSDDPSPNEIARLLKTFHLFPGPFQPVAEAEAES